MDLLGKYKISPKHASCLDLGCGGGEITLKLSPYFKFIHGIDKLIHLVSKARASSLGTTNVLFSEIDVKDLSSSNLSVDFQVVIARNALHFVEDVPQLFEDISSILKLGGGGVFLVITSPLFELGVENDSELSSLVNNEFEEFCEANFAEELNDYWNEGVRRNFAQYCDPEKTLYYNEKFDTVDRFQWTSSSHVHLLDLKDSLTKLTIVERYIQKNGMDEFDALWDGLLQKVCILMDIAFDDLLFEHVQVLRMDTFYVQVYSILLDVQEKID